MSTWFRTETTFARHRKNRRLNKLLGLPGYAAPGLVSGLFCQVCAEAPDGDITDWDADDIAHACQWDGDPQQLYDALMEVRFIVRVADRVEVNDWMEYAEGYRAAQRVRKHREKKKAELEAAPGNATVTLQKRNSSVTVTSTDGRTDGTDVQTHVELRHEEQKEKIVREETKAGSSTADAADLFGHPVKKRGSIHEDVLGVWAHYCSHHPKAPKVLKRDRKEYHLIRRTLEDFAPEDIKNAIDGFHRDPWYRGQNKRERVYLSLTTLLREASQVQKGLEMYEAHRRAARKVDRLRLVSDNSESNEGASDDNGLSRSESVGCGLGRAGALAFGDSSATG